MFIDTHTHYYDEIWSPAEADEAIGRAVAAGVGKMIQADVDSLERPHMWEVAKRHEGVLFQMAGLYPGSVKKDWEEEVEKMLPFVPEAVAIGEIGLDYHEEGAMRKEQQEALKVQFEIASGAGLPVNIHLRDATGDFLKVLSECRHLGLRGNLHCFGGSWEFFTRVNTFGDFSVGIGGVVTFKNASLAETVRKIPLEKIVLETDCPYLAPVPYRGKRNESAYIPLIAEKIALQKGIDIEEVEAVTTANAQKLFGI